MSTSTRTPSRTATGARRRAARGPGVTGMPEPRRTAGGTREICNWIAAAGGGGRPARATVVDYVPIYASPVGAGFAYWPAA